MPSGGSRSGDRVARAIELLREELVERLARHPAARSARGAEEGVDLSIRLPGDPKISIADAVEATRNQIRTGVHALVAHHSLVRPGRCFCLRCASSECEHSAPPSGREVFAGYGPSGLPRFHDFGQFLLEEGEAADALYSRPRRLVVAESSEERLARDLLDVFRDREGGFRLHGQVAAGWYTHRGQPFAVTFQLLSTRREGQQVRFDINAVGVGPEAEPLDELQAAAPGEDGRRHDREHPPWHRHLVWSRRALGDIEKSIRREGSGARTAVRERLDGLLAGLARRLRKEERGSKRRTNHAETRRKSGSRPTHKALADLHEARNDRIFFDTKEQTLVVLGSRGRIHVFTDEGRHVTSLRLESGGVASRKRRGRWREARPDEISGLKQRVSGDADLS